MPVASGAEANNFVRGRQPPAGPGAPARPASGPPPAPVPRAGSVPAGTLVTVREQNGPGFNAKSIKNPETHELKAGDMIVIPAGTGHWFTKIDDHITYAMVRIDPDKILPLKSEAQSRAHLATPYTPGQGNF